MKILSPALKRIWEHWDLRVTVMLSLVLQIVLIILGNRRKYNHRAWLSFVLWCVYLSADAIATASLGVISSNLSDLFEDNAGYIIDANVELTAFWAPFLLLHLGGPDTITSYSLEDNELWLRHFLGLIVQTGVVIYVLSMAWTGSYLTFLFILMLFAGLIKYGERTLSLWKASSEKLRNKFKRVHKNDEDQVGQRFLKQHGSKDEEGYFVGTDMITPFDFPVDLSRVCGSNVNNNSVCDEDRLVIANSLLNVTMSLFSDTILASTVKETTHYLFKNLSVENAFKIIEMETAFTFDLLYTKAPVLYTPYGLFLHFVTFFLTLLVLLLFTFLAQKHKYSKVDLFVTFGLLIGALILEIYAAFVLLSSDRAIVWFWKHNKFSTWHIPSFFPSSKGLRWSNQMAQYSLLKFSLKEKTHWGLKILERLHCLNILKRFNMDKWLEEKLHATYKEVPEGFKRLIFQNLKDKAAKQQRGTKNPKSDDPPAIEEGAPTGTSEVEESTSNRYSQRISDFGRFKELISHNLKDKAAKQPRDTKNPKSDDPPAIEEAAPTGTSEVEESTSNRYSQRIPDFGDDLSKRILFWHFITELSYYIDKNDLKDDSKCNCKLMKKISRYMMYLLVNHPSLLSIGISSVSFEDEADTLADAFSKIRSETITDKRKYLADNGFGDHEKGVLQDAYSLMKKMEQNKEKKWEEISCNWLELLAYAASKCKGRLHAQNLRFGGELLTHVWLLMAQFGLTEHFQTSEKLHIARLVSG